MTLCRERSSLGGTRSVGEVCPHFISQWVTSPIISLEALPTLMTPTQVSSPPS